MNKYLHITNWPEDKVVTLGGRVTCIQCNATSKYTKEWSRAPAMKGQEKGRLEILHTL